MGQDTGPSSFAQASLNTGVPTQLSGEKLILLPPYL